MSCVFFGLTCSTTASCLSWSSLFWILKYAWLPVTVTVSWFISPPIGNPVERAQRWEFPSHIFPERKFKWRVAREIWFNKEALQVLHFTVEVRFAFEDVILWHISQCETIQNLKHLGKWLFSCKFVTNLKVHKIDIFFGFDFEICIISLLVMSKY